MLRLVRTSRSDSPHDAERFTFRPASMRPTMIAGTSRTANRVVM